MFSLLTRNKGKLSDRGRNYQGEKRKSSVHHVLWNQGIVQRNGVLELRKAVKAGRAVVGSKKGTN